MRSSTCQVLVDSGDDDKSDDMRFKLKESEQEAVVALKAACDKEAVVYYSIFDLAKYVLVSHSSAPDNDPMAKEKRLKMALNRMKKRHKWEEKYQIRAVDVMEALKEIDQNAPGFFVNHYTKDHEGRVIVGHHHCHVPADYIYASDENLSKYFAVEQWRYQLAAADMEEARQGMALVGVTDGEASISNAFQYARFVTKAREHLKEIHCHRVRGIYSEVPFLLKQAVKPILKLLPAKIVGRVKIVNGMSQLENHLGKLPQGQRHGSAFEWAQERNSTYQETLRRLRI